MTKYYKLTADGRIGVTAGWMPEGATFDFPDDFDFSGQMNYKLVDGALVYDPLPERAAENPVDAALMELAGILAATEARLDEQDAALMELAAMLGGGETDGTDLSAGNP